MTPSELKYQYQENNPTGHFFDRETMRFFGEKNRRNINGLKSQNSTNQRLTL